MSFVPFINRDKCIGCRICVDVCPNDVFSMGACRAVVMHPERCEGCGICAENCPTDAISIKMVV